MAEIIIGKIELSSTINGNPKASIYPEGSDFNNPTEAIEIIGENEVMYLSTRRIGEKVTVTEKGKWKNITIPEEYINALNSPSYERVKILFKRSFGAIYKAINGGRPQLDLDTAKLMITDNLDLFFKVQDIVVKNIQKNNSEFTKQLSKDLKSENETDKFNAWKIVNDLTMRNISDLSKDYEIVNDYKEKK